MITVDFIEALRTDIKEGLRIELLAELQPEIERRLFSNVFTIEEAMRYLRISKSTIRRLMKDGNIPHFYQRENLYFRQIDLDKHIANIIIKPSKEQLQAQ